MEPATAVLLTCLIFVLAAVYASVGLAGASGYLAAMAFVGIIPDVMKPTALLLNVIVAGIGTIRLGRAGAIDGPLLRRLLIAAVPVSFLGGAVRLPAQIYEPAVGAILLFVAVRLLATAHRSPESAGSPPRLLAVATAGAAIGLLSGLTGTGGGLFLPPLLLVTGWTDARKTAGVTAAFNLGTSLAGFGGTMTSLPALPVAVAAWAVAAAAGGLIGAEIAARRAAPRSLHYVLAGVLLLAAIKLTVL